MRDFGIAFGHDRPPSLLFKSGFHMIARNRSRRSDGMWKVPNDGHRRDPPGGLSSFRWLGRILKPLGRPGRTERPERSNKQYSSGGIEFPCCEY